MRLLNEPRASVPTTDAAMAIRADALTRTFGNRVAVDAVSFDAPPGEIFGFLGPNGAGTSTTVRMPTGCIAPTAGRALANVAQRPAAARRHIGVVPEEANVYADLSVLELAGFAVLFVFLQPGNSTNARVMDHHVDAASQAAPGAWYFSAWDAGVHCEGTPLSAAWSTGGGLPTIGASFVYERQWLRPRHVARPQSINGKAARFDHVPDAGSSGTGSLPKTEAPVLRARLRRPCLRWARPSVGHG
jgi:hypothetical protein